MRHESTYLSDSEHNRFQNITAGLDAEVEAAKLPTDGWDPVPRTNPLEGLDAHHRHTNGRYDIPTGHIAFMGDFDKPTS